MALAFSSRAATDTPENATKQRKFQFTYTATLKAVPEKAKHVDLWIPIPQSDEFQEISKVTFSGKDHPDVELEPVQNNSMAHWKIEAAAAKDFSITMKVECVRHEISIPDLTKARDLSADEKEKLAPYLQANKLVLVGGEFSTVADAATNGAKTPAEIAKSAYDYTVSTMKYDKPKDKPGWGNGSTQWACDAKFGNCTDFHALIMSINRTKGVPVKFEIGFPIPEVVAGKPETQAGPVGGYHCWAKCYLGGVGWVAVDASEAQKHPEKRDYFYGHLDVNRIHFSNGRDVNLVPKQSGDPLNYFIYPYAEADGKSIAVERAFSFKDL
jgi:transglutaminase-like putative cysteine protease